MSDKIDLCLLDNLNNILEERYIIKPMMFSELLDIISKNFKNLSKYYNIFYLSENNNEIIISNDDEYKLSKDIIFIREIKNENMKKSMFENNYNKLSQSKQEILDEKYNCLLCNEIIKKEKPLFCYKCQKIFHKKCLEIRAKKRKSQNQDLECPYCKNELPLEEWRYKLDYEDDRINDAEKMDKIYKNKLNYNLYYNIIKIKDKKINELTEDKNEIIERYYTDIKNISLKINEINSLINNYKLNVEKLFIDNISNEIIQNLEVIQTYINNNFSINNIKKEELDNQKEKNNKKDEKFQYKNKINLIYFTEKEGVENIFGFNFVENNKNKIDLIINGNKTSLSETYLLNKGDNYITLIIKSKLTDLSYMFYNCFSISNMEELRYLDTTNVTNFSYIFSSKDNYSETEKKNIKTFHSFSDINYLSTWNVSSGTNFDSIFRGCHKLSNIKALENWNVSKGIKFSNMFCSCYSLSDLSSLKNWNVSKGQDFYFMFPWCYSLTNITPLKNWDVSNAVKLYGMFLNCEKLSDIKPLEKWNVSRCKEFSDMFYECHELSNISGLENWDVSKCENFSEMFYGCNKLSNIRELENWNVSKCENFTKMFYGCDKLSNIDPLKNWKVLKNANFFGMLYGCNKLSNLNSIKKWNISKKAEKDMLQSDDLF